MAIQNKALFLSADLREIVFIGLLWLATGDSIDIAIIDAIRTKKYSVVFIDNPGKTFIGSIKKIRLYIKQPIFVFICIPPENERSGKSNASEKKNSFSFPYKENNKPIIISFTASFLIISKA